MKKKITRHLNKERKYIWDFQSDNAADAVKVRDKHNGGMDSCCY